MRRRFVPLACLAAAGGLALGCESSQSRLPFQQDPLLLSRKPVEMKAEDADKERLVLADPVPPLPPDTALATAPGTGTRPTGPVAGEVLPPQIPARPVSTPKAAAGPEAQQP